MRPVLGEEQNPSNPTFAVTAALFPVKYSHFLQDILARELHKSLPVFKSSSARTPLPSPLAQLLLTQQTGLQHHLPYAGGLSKSPSGNLLALILFSSLVSPNCWAKALVAPRENTQHLPSTRVTVSYA